MIDRETVKEALTGPIASIRTPFAADGSVDFDALRAVVDFNIEAGSKVSLLTAGDSHYSVLSEDEITEVTRVVAEHTGDRALTVAADREYPTDRAVEFARAARRLGADVIMVKPPDWAGSVTADNYVAHYRAVAEVMPVMVVTNVFRNRGDDFGLKVLKAVRDSVDGVVALKDDVCGVFARRAAALLHDRWAVFAGGQKQNHLNMHPYGCHGYMSVFLCFKPEVAYRYWAAICSDDVREAGRIVREIEWPLFDLMGGMPGGSATGMRGVLELFGICERWRRPPYPSLTDRQMAELEAGLKELDIL